jgi:2-dehydropantoate 2-reductase
MLQRVCIFGAGAIGGFIGVRLANAGADVSAVARGATASALRTHGWRLLSEQAMTSARVRVAEQASELGSQDLVVIAVKGPALASVAAAIAPLLHERTIVMTAMNGVPWWFFEGFGGRWQGTRLTSIDPRGQIAAAIPGSHVVGCVVHAGCTTPEPGVTRNQVGRRLIIGEPNGAPSTRIEALAALLQRAGFDTEVSRCIQRDIWYKLWGNMTMNPVSALTGATLDRILDDPLVDAYCLEVMREAAEIGAKIGCPIEQSGADRNAITRKLGAYKTSMLQDVEAGKPVEIDVLLAAVREIGQAADVSTPTLDSLLGLARLHARTRGLYPGDPSR